MHPKTIVGFILLAISTTLLIAIGIILIAAMKRDHWCNTSTLDAGDCYAYEDYWNCFCIDHSISIDGHQLDPYEDAQAACKKLNGALATPEDKKLFIWLSKRMYLMNVDHAIVGLKRMDSTWYWMKPSGPELITKQLMWRPGFPRNKEHNYAMITVETLKLQQDYQWYGLTTSNETETFSSGVHHICHYVANPKPMKKVSTLPPTTTEINTDPCFCHAEESIVLSSLDQSETFTSPGYPSNYCSDTSCRWIITTPQDLIVKLEWIVFNLEEDMDFLYIYDGKSVDDDSAERLAKCSGSRCSNQLSSGAAIEVHFRSDHVTTDLGFKGRVTATSPDPCYCASLSLVTMANLGETYSILSPNYPDPYCSNHKCAWKVIAPKGLGLHVVWNKFKNSYNDRIIVYDGESSEDKQLSMCSGTTCSNVISSGETILIDFVSGQLNSVDGSFSALVTVVQNYCEKNQLQLLGHVSYSGEREDNYIPVGSTATLTCDYSTKIEGSVGTTTDNVTCTSPDWKRKLSTCVQACITDTSATETNLPYKNMTLCELKSNETTTLVNDGVRLVMRSYDIVNDTQVSPNSIYICNGTTWLPETPDCHFTASACYCAKQLSVAMSNIGESYALLSPNYPKPYCTSQNCAWSVTAPKALGLQIRWNKFKIADDQLLVSDGSSAQAKELTKCSGESCENVISTGDAIHITFISGDNADKAYGGSFSALITVVKNYCEKDQVEEDIHTGIISYSKEREDGYIPPGSTVTLTCEHSTKIQHSIETTVDVVSCVSPNWETKLKPCVDACIMDRTISSNVPLGDMHVCKLKSSHSTTLVTDGDELTMTRYDFIKDQQLAQPITYTCSGKIWQPETPLCHFTVCEPFPLTPHLIASYSGSKIVSGDNVTLTCDGLYNLYVNGKRHNDLSVLVTCQAPEWQSTDVECAGRLLVIDLESGETESYYPEDPDRNQKEASLIPDRKYPSISVVENKIIIAGGQNYSYWYLLSTVIYDPSNKSFATGPDMWRTKMGTGSTAVGKTLYVCGGWWDPLDCETFSGNHWAMIASMSYERSDCILTALNGKVYALAALDAVESYDASTNTWLEVAPIPAKPTDGVAATTAQGNIFMCAIFSNNGDTTKCYKYSDVTNSWSGIKPMFENRYSYVLVELGGKILAVGGGDHYTVEIYDPELGHWIPQQKRLISETLERLAAVVIKY